VVKRRVVYSKASAKVELSLPTVLRPMSEILASVKHNDCACWVSFNGRWENEACPSHGHLDHQDPRDPAHEAGCYCGACEDSKRFNRGMRVK
jgi:hypothetical protein